MYHVLGNRDENSEKGRQKKRNIRFFFLVSPSCKVISGFETCASLYTGMPCRTRALGGVRVSNKGQMLLETWRFWTV